MKKIARFLVGVKSEIKKVRWLNKKEMVKYSVATLMFVVLFAMFFGCVDLVLAGLKMVIK